MDLEREANVPDKAESKANYEFQAIGCDFIYHTISHCDNKEAYNKPQWAHYQPWRYRIPGFQVGIIECASNNGYDNKPDPLENKKECKRNKQRFDFPLKGDFDVFITLKNITRK